MFLTLAGHFGVLFANDPRLLWLRSALARQFLMQCCDALEAGRAFVRDSPLPEENINSLADVNIHRFIAS